MNELVKDNLLDKFHQAGLKIFGLDNIKKDEEDETNETNPEESNPEEIKGTDIKIYPHYNNNFGFFTACIDDIKFIILKGQYSDNIRYISGKPSFNNAE